MASISFSRWAPKRSYWLEERFELPLVGVGLFGGVLVEDVGEDGGEVVVGDELLLVDSLHELPAQTIDGFALLVHDVVVFEDVFAGLEVLGFDGFLRGFDAAGDHAGFDGDALFHAEALEERGDPLAGEDAHEVVFEREEEARGAGIALTAGAAAELVVDAADSWRSVPRMWRPPAAMTASCSVLAAASWEAMASQAACVVSNSWPV